MRTKGIIVLVMTVLGINVNYAQISLSQRAKELMGKSVGVTFNSISNSNKGYVLFSPSTSKYTYLLDQNGVPVNVWTSNYFPGQTAYLDSSLNLIRTCKLENVETKLLGLGGKIEKRNWDNELLWEFTLNDSVSSLHHDICLLPNGNILAIVVDRYSKKKAYDLGRDTSNLVGSNFWLEKIIEIKPESNNKASIVWEWNSIDHLVQSYNSKAKNYEKGKLSSNRININYDLKNNNTSDLIHLNSIQYDANLDLIIVSARNYNECWVIDHSTSKVQSKSSVGGKYNKGGDIVYRWGNSNAYNLKGKQYYFAQHSLSFVNKGYLNEGKILAFNNLSENGSSIVLSNSPFYNLKTKKIYNSRGVFLPDSATTIFVKGMKEKRGGSVQGLPDGNMLVCETSKGKISEITSNGDSVWVYVCPLYNGNSCEQGEKTYGGNDVFKAQKYFISEKKISTYRKETVYNTIERNPSKQQCSNLVVKTELINKKDFILSKQAKPFFDVQEIGINNKVEIKIFNSNGKLYDCQTISRLFVGGYTIDTYYILINQDIYKMKITE